MERLLDEFGDLAVSMAFIMPLIIILAGVLVKLTV